MTCRLIFCSLVAVAAIAVAVGCGSTASSPVPSGSSAPLYTPTPAPKLLYVDHNGKFYEYRLPLTAASKPVLELTEWPNLVTGPQIAADQYGNVALASPYEIRFFSKPIVSFAPSHARMRLTLTPGITEVGATGGAALIDMEYDPNENLWLFNNLGAEISELRAPITKSSVAAVTIGFGAPGSKTAGFTSLVQGRFDVNATLYVYATCCAPPRSKLFKIAFPYAKPPSVVGINLGEADFVDSSQWPPTAPVAPSLLLGQYIGALHSPTPGTPPSPPVDVTAQFAQPFNPQVGLFPDAHTQTNVGALVADTYRYSYYTLDADDGALSVYPLPMKNNAKPSVTIPCLAGLGNCDKLEHLFLAP